jgi:hypothetical protein
MACDQTANPHLQVLHESGVSIRLDTRSRDLLGTREFAPPVAEHSVTGAPGLDVERPRRDRIGLATDE